MEPRYSGYENYYAHFQQGTYQDQSGYRMNRNQQQAQNPKYLDKYLEDYTIDEDQFEVDYQNHFQNDFEHYEPEKPQPQEYDQVKVLCTYCNISFPLGDFTEHEDQCEMRKISCERCGKKVLIEEFEAHEGNCAQNGQIGNLRPNNYPKPNRRQQGFQEERPQRQQNPNYMNNTRNTRQTGRRGNQQQEVIPQIEPRRNHANRLPLYDHDNIYQFDYMHMNDHHQQEVDTHEIPESATYEDLLALDENVVKKGLSKPQIDRFKTRTFITSTESCKTCNVCISDFEMGDRLRKIKCGHEFHTHCIDTWLKDNITCPICKKEMR